VILKKANKDERHEFLCEEYKIFIE